MGTQGFLTATASVLGRPMVSSSVGAASGPQSRLMCGEAGTPRAVSAGRRSEQRGPSSSFIFNGSDG
jgi:hypothetical protein